MALKHSRAWWINNLRSRRRQLFCCICWGSKRRENKYIKEMLRDMHPITPHAFPLCSKRWRTKHVVCRMHFSRQRYIGYVRADCFSSTQLLYGLCRSRDAVILWLVLWNQKFVMSGTFGVKEQTHFGVGITLDVQKLFYVHRKPMQRMHLL